jgi:hypothetical protein
VGLQQGFATSEMGLNRHFRGNNAQRRMSALGQKQTLDERQLMSALPPKADIKPRSTHAASFGSSAMFAAIRCASSLMMPINLP